MTQVTIHIGLHKTATTYFQTEVFPGVKNATLLSRPYTQLNHAFNKMQFADDSLYDEAEFRAELAQFGDGDLVLSDEMFAGAPLYNVMNRTTVARRLASVFPDATIVLFLRGQRSLISALHNSWVKNIGGTRSLDSLLHTPGTDYRFEEYDTRRWRAGEGWKNNAARYFFVHDALSIHPTTFEYDRLVALYQDLFPRVEVFLFEDFRDDPQAVISRVAEVTGLDFDLPEELPKAVNERMGARRFRARRARNALQHFVTKPRLVSGLERVIAMMPVRGSDDSSVVDELAGHYAASNRRLAELCPGLPLDRYGDDYDLD